MGLMVAEVEEVVMEEEEEERGRLWARDWKERELRRRAVEAAIVAAEVMMDLRNGSNLNGPIGDKFKRNQPNESKPQAKPSPTESRPRQQQANRKAHSSLGWLGF